MHLWAIILNFVKKKNILIENCRQYLLLSSNKNNHIPTVLKCIQCLEFSI